MVVDNVIEEKVTFDPFAGPEIERVIYTTRSQEEIWTACRLGGANANKAYNESISLKLKGELNQGAIDRALQTLVTRHESLRAVFSTDGRFMTIFKQLDTDLNFVDVSGLETDQREVALADYLEDDANHLFNLVKGPLLKAGLIKLNEREHLFILTAHHIICDGWSLGIMLQELGALYSAEVARKTPDLPKADSFSEYADEQQTLNQSSEYEEIERFWLEQYKGSVPQVDIPTDFPRPSLRTFKSKRLDFPMKPDLLEAVKKTGTDAGCSLVSTLLAGFEVFLHQLTGEKDLVIGLPAAGQSAAGKLQLVGHCVNLLPLRSELTADASFNSYLKRRKSELFDAYEHQQLSFGHLLQKLSIARDPSRVPLVPITFNIDLGLTDGVAFEGLTYELFSNPREYETFELFLNASGSADNLVFEWSYNSALFRPGTIDNMMASFEALLLKLTEAPNEPLSEIARVDHTSSYAALNSTSVDYTMVSLPELIWKQVRSSPHKTALVFNKTEINYGHLQSQTNRLTRYLMASGVKSGDLLGVSIPRCAELPMLLLAIMQCGAAFVPLDPTYPASRLKFMLEDSGAKFLIRSKTVLESFPSEGILLPLEDALAEAAKYPDTAIDTNIDLQSLAYQIYTSGSTGKPKGVRAKHVNLINFLQSMVDEPGINEDDRLLSITSVSFDPVFLELFLPLMKGATIVLANDETAKDGRLLLEMLQTENISILQATPTTWQMLFDSGWRNPLPLKALCGGEALSRGLAIRLLDHCEELWNIYGPTETTVWSVIKKIDRNDYPITIGRPIANMQLYLLDENDKLVAPGKVGEICLAGMGMTLGYWNRPELNAEKFIDNPFGDDFAILYKSGDLGKLLPNGEIECLGRVDQQIKIRGHRIEPGEIEQTLIAIEGISAAAVVAKSDRLVAYIVPSYKISSPQDRIDLWRKALTIELPAHLVPHDFNLLRELPKTPNGKIDRKALMSPGASDKNTPKSTAPRTDDERLVAQIWQESLGLGEVDIFSNFFELGGHSLIAVKVMAQIEKKTGKRLPLSALFEYSTVEKLAVLLAEGNTDDLGADSLVPIKPNGNKAPLYIVHGAGLNVLIFNALANGLDADQPVYGLQAPNLTGADRPFRTIEEIAAHYVDTIIEANPKGPYALAGYSFGGYIAYEMARQITAKGRKVTMLGLLDTYAEPHYFYSSPMRKRIATLGYHIERLSVLFKDMTSGWDKFKFHFNRKKEGFLERYFKKETEQSTEQAGNQGHFEVEKGILQIMKRYHLIAHDIKIDLFRAEEQIYYVHDPEHLGWKNLALKGIKVHDVPGNHLNMFLPPFDKTTGRVLQSVLDLRNSEN